MIDTGPEEEGEVHTAPRAKDGRPAGRRREKEREKGGRETQHSRRDWTHS